MLEYFLLLLLRYFFGLGEPYHFEASKRVVSESSSQENLIFLA